MQIVIEVADTKAGFVVELLSNLPFVAIQPTQTSERDTELNTIQPLSPKTSQLLGLFPQLADETEARQPSILGKHAR